MFLQAKVDTNRDQITFARPDLEHLRIFCNEKFGWPFNKTDELMVPVLKVRQSRHRSAGPQPSSENNVFFGQMREGTPLEELHNARQVATLRKEKAARWISGHGKIAVYAMH